MPSKRGDVILANVRFTSGVASKVRPALVVQSDQNNLRLTNTIIAIITTTTRRAQKEATQLFIDVATPDGKQSGLLYDSAVKCEHLETILQADIHRVIGSLSPAQMQQIDQSLKVSLGIP